MRVLAFDTRFCQVCGREIPMMYTDPGSMALTAYSRRKYCSQRCFGASRRGIPHHHGYYVGRYLDKDVTTGDVLRLFTHVIITERCWLWNHASPQVRPSWRLGYLSVNPGRVMKWLFCNEHESELQLCHSCDNHHCVNPTHTFWGTDKDNYEDSRRKGRNSEGERQGNARLTAAQVIEIRKLHDAGHTIVSLAAYYGVAEGTVSAVIHRRNWKSV